jgi:hypothetical protein
MKPISKICLALLAIALLVGLTTPVFAGGEIKGKVMSVDPDNLSFVIQTATKGRVLPFELDEDASVFINNQEQSIQELRAGDDRFEWRPAILSGWTPARRWRVPTPARQPASL